MYIGNVYTWGVVLNLPPPFNTWRTAMEIIVNDSNRHYWVTKQNGIEYLVFFSKTKTGVINVMYSNKTIEFKSLSSANAYCTDVLKVYPLKRFV